ncbi:hypothetical protein PRK78_006349 [Emydomyces testavorans]|uniref:Uncharacterized protein n=1 Tax=Emydomyces testavorans TaxID=2070801 RepID=A0AAF0DP03_9EURO|nr:hypothetical protein PRK78_006349 [Emydomyces testavorans]
MAFPNHLAEDCYDGAIDGIQLGWSNSAKSWLGGQAAKSKVDRNALKAVTEHLLHRSAKRLGQDRARVIARPHDTTTDMATGMMHENQFHVSGILRPGRLMVHIYLSDLGEGPSGFDNLKVTRESVVKRHQKNSDH